MKYRRLGKSKLNVSEISLGGMSLKENTITSVKLIHKVIDYGINLFDTADLYEKGQNELLIGQALKDHRKDVIIATKVGNQWRKDGNGWDWNPRKTYVLKAVDESLTRLQTDYIDLYQLHGGTIDDPIDEIIDAFETLQKQGKIRYYGISSIRPNVIQEYVKRSSIVSVMMQYSLLDRRPEEESLGLLEKNNIGVLARGTLAKGLLAGKPAIDYLGYSVTEVKNTIKVLKEVSGKERNIGQTAIQYILKNGALSSAVIGVRTSKQLDECFEKTSIAELFDEDYLMLKKSNIPLRYTNHR
ncbi:aldo/keto reductase [Aquimarina sp. AU474]|uniref:aldo/keto reductase n=1 Tax=Aquimarina sp. AU474 TaxID=2108529 RepID=UPI000D692543|nr:aldo/keto reductase [Aquimarina sp. AU474]